MPAVEVHGLVVQRGPVRAVDGLDLEASAGQVTVLLGPNGAGKTTTVETLVGLRRPYAGQVRVLGLDPVAQRRGVLTRTGAMPQDGGVYPGLRAREALRLFAAYHRAPADPDELLARVGLADRDRRTWRQLSGGERQRLSLALALVGRPEVALLDEPTSGVDVGGRGLVRAAVRDLAREGVAVVLTTHELDEAERLADRVVIVDHGRVVAEGTLEELLRSTDRPELRFDAPSGLDLDGLAGALGAPVAEPEPGRYVVAAEGTPARVAALATWLAQRDLPLGELRAGRHRLEDVFLRLTGTDGPGATEGSGA